MTLKNRIAIFLCFLPVVVFGQEAGDELELRLQFCLVDLKALGFGGRQGKDRHTLLVAGETLLALFPVADRCLHQEGQRPGNRPPQLVLANRRLIRRGQIDANSQEQRDSNDSQWHWATPALNIL